jgi:sugar lactone lactonase YvrE
MGKNRYSSDIRTTRVVLDGHVFPEVPRWKDGRLWFCDFQLWVPGATGQENATGYRGAVIMVDEDGTAQTVIDKVPGGPPNGLAWLPDGRLLITAGGGRALLAMELGGRLTRYADLSGVTSYWLNELVVDTSGTAYVGSSQVPPDPRTLTELIIVRPDGRTEVADSSMRFPNGFMITPDGRTLIAAESTGHCLTAFTIGDDHGLRDKRVWASLPGVIPDGPCLDQEGCVWCADAVGKACIRVAEGGLITDRVETDQDAFACTLGGDDGRTLFIMTSINPFMGGKPSGRPGKVVAVEVDVPGAGSA